MFICFFYLFKFWYETKSTKRKKKKQTEKKTSNKITNTETKIQNIRTLSASKLINLFFSFNLIKFIFFFSFGTFSIHLKRKVIHSFEKCVRKIESFFLLCRLKIILISTIKGREKKFDVAQKQFCGRN